MKDSKRVELEEVNNGFVVLEADIMGELLEALPQELVLLLFEDIGDVELLQFLIGEVNEELLEGIDHEDFEAEDVQQPDTPPVLARLLSLEVNLLDFDLLIQFGHQVVEDLLVDVLGK